MLRVYTDIYMRQVRPGNGFTGTAPYTLCPWCYNNPPEGEGGGGSAFPCFRVCTVTDTCDTTTIVDSA
jgi:hypothetical protein